MKIMSAVAIYFVIWWTCLFIVLPWGVRNAHETGEVIGEGHEAGAPVNPMLWRKVIATTILAMIVYGLIYVLLGWLGVG